MLYNVFQRGKNKTEQSAMLQLYENKIKIIGGNFSRIIFVIVINKTFRRRSLCDALNDSHAFLKTKNNKIE